MLDNVQLQNILFLDIETVSEKATFEELDGEKAQFWEKKSMYFRKEDESASDVYEKAAIYSEFGKIICISVGLILEKGNIRHFRVKSFSGHDEKLLLQEFAVMLNQFCNKRDVNLCGHNGKEFDFPYISRRMLINGLKLPKILETAGLKPWEIKFLDTLELWKFGDYKHYTSLALLAHIFNIPTPKDDIDGSMVGRVYWHENDLERIATYCEKDVLTVAQLLLRYKGEPIIEEVNVERSGK